MNMLNDNQLSIEQKRLIGSLWCNGAGISSLRILIGFETIQTWSNQSITKCMFLLGNGRIHHSIFNVDDLLQYENDDDQKDFRRVG